MSKETENTGGSLHNPNFGIDKPIAKGEINTGGLGYKALIHSDCVNKNKSIFSGSQHKNK